MVPGDRGILTSFCPRKIKIPEIENLTGVKTSINELDLPSPRLMHINFGTPFKIFNVEHY